MKRSILAADHRDSMKVMLNPEDMDAVPAEVVTGSKLDTLMTSDT